MPSKSQGVSLPHAATWRPGALGVLVCACVAWVCGWCVCACMSAADLICGMWNVSCCLNLQLNCHVCFTVHGVCMAVLRYACLCMVCVCSCCEYISYACLCKVYVCVHVMSSYACLWMVCVCMWFIAMHAYARCVCVHVMSSYACLCMVYVCMYIMSSVVVPDVMYGVLID